MTNRDKGCLSPRTRGRKSGSREQVGQDVRGDREHFLGGFGEFTLKAVNNIVERTISRDVWQVRPNIL